MNESTFSMIKLIKSGLVKNYLKNYN